MLRGEAPRYACNRPARAHGDQRDPCPARCSTAAAGRPWSAVTLTGGSRRARSVPSGASTGTAEAHELRDGERRLRTASASPAPSRTCAARSPRRRGRDALDQHGARRRAARLDGTPDLSRLGANAILARHWPLPGRAAGPGRPLYRRIAELAGVDDPTLPLPMVNILSGGLHAGRGMDVQDFLAVPVGATSYSEAMARRVRSRRGARLCAERGLPTLLADEGGLSPGCAPAARRSS